jgi:chromate transport protein ChrA
MIQLYQPGPEAQQLATYIGWLMHRTRGGLGAGTLFVDLPAAVLCALAMRAIFKLELGLPKTVAASAALGAAWKRVRPLLRDRCRTTCCRLSCKRGSPPPRSGRRSAGHRGMTSTHPR